MPLNTRLPARITQLITSLALTNSQLNQKRKKNECKKGGSHFVNCLADQRPFSSTYQ